MSKKLKYLRLLKDASICECDVKLKVNDNTKKLKIENITQLEDFSNLKYNIYDHLDYKYIIFFGNYKSNVSNDLQKNIIKLPFTEKEYYGTIYLFKADSDLSILNLSTNKFMALFDKVKINKLIEEDYSSDDFNPDICDNSKKC